MNNINISLIGFFLSPNGLGQAVRNIAHSLETTSLSFDCININGNPADYESEFLNKCSKYTPNKINLIVCGLDTTEGMLNLIKNLGSGKKNYLYPFWELDRIPSKFIKVISSYDCLIAPSQFIADIFQKYLDYDIPVITQPVIVPKDITPNKINDGIIRIFSMMDFTSFIHRKNPIAILNTFQRAFPKNIRNVELILKIKGERDLGFRSLLRSVCQEDNRIKLIDKNLNRNEITCLINNCNIFLSLHRSEGFGFGPAEAMASGKIVVSTEYGGVTDFLDKSTGYPIPYKLVPVNDGEYLFSENQLWAEPSVCDAASALQNIYSNFSHATERAKKGRELMIEKYSFIPTGKKIKGFLEKMNS